MINDANHLYEFGSFRIDTHHRRLFREEEAVALQPKAFEILLVLVTNCDRIVLKDELLKAVWPDTFVEESNLAQNISVLRKALGDTKGANRYIVTVPGRGYRFAEEVRTMVATEEKKSEEQIMVASHSLTKVVIAEDNSEAPTLAFVGSTRQVRKGLALALVAGFVIAGSIAGRRHYRSANAANPNRTMLAVLPFQNLTGDPDQEYFADGLTEEMITKLGQLYPEKLGIIARTSVMAYKHTDKRMSQIGQELSVQYVLEGGYRRAADRLRITAQLIRVQDQSHLWAEEYDRQPKDILGVQDDVALAVAREIQLRLTPQQRMRLSASVVSPEAHENYLKGRFFWNKRTEEGFRKAIEYFQAAIAADPNYAQAYAGLADTYLLLGGYGFEPQEEAEPEARKAALHAVQINDTLAEPYVALGLVYTQWDWNWLAAEKSFKRAIELNPNYSVAHHWYASGYLAAIPGKTEEMLFELRKAHELDPLSPMITTDLAAYLCSAGRCDEGMKEFQQVLKIDPDFVQAHYYLSQAYELRGMYSEAIAEVQKVKSPDASRYVTGQLGHIYALQGRRREALDVVSKLQKLSDQAYVDPRYIANIYVALGDKDLAFVWLEKAYEEHSPTITGLKTCWLYDSIRSDPRFVELVRRVGIP